MNNVQPLIVGRLDFQDRPMDSHGNGAARWSTEWAETSADVVDDCAAAEAPETRDAQHVEPRNWRLWIPLGLLAFGVYEFTAQAPLSLTILCLKFGANDLATGYWLWRRDPWRPRGRALFWFYTAFGLTKVCGIALVGCFLCVILLAHAQPNQIANGPPVLVIEGSIVMLVACLTAVLCVVVGLVLARLARVRIWVSSVPAADRRADLFPPMVKGENRARVLIIFAFLIFAAVAFTACLLAMLDPGARPGGAPAGQAEIWLKVALPVAALVLPTLAGFVIAERMGATHACECWHDWPDGGY